jgi:hypothetical protein
MAKGRHGAVAERAELAVKVDVRKGREGRWSRDMLYKLYMQLGVEVRRILSPVI